MDNKALIVNTFINRGIIEANIEFSQQNDSPLSIMKFGYEVDTEDIFLFKNLVSLIYSYSDFNPILQQENDTFILFFRDCKIHEAKSLVTHMVQKVKQNLKINIEHIGITLLDSEDTYKSLLDRLDKYFVMSKLSSRKKTFYGTLDFDFYETQDDKQVLKNIFKKSNSISLFNFYKGLPITEKMEILKFDQGLIQLKTSPIKLPFYKNEKFTFIQHDLIPTILKASIVKVQPDKSLLVLGNLEFLDSSPVERSSIRVEPERAIYASLALGKKKLLDGTIVSLSQNSVVLDVKIDNITSLTKKPLWGIELSLQFQIPTSKGFLTTIKTKAMIYSIVEKRVVLNISPSKAETSKLKNYISLRQEDVLLRLKYELKKFS